MHRGYVTIHRKILDNPIVFKDSDHLAVWVYLLLHATHKKYQALFEGRSIELLPGQLITGRRSIASKLKINENKVQRILELLKNEHLIEQQTSNQNRLLTLVSWNIYQQCEQQNEQRVNNERTTGEQRVNTNKNVKNVEPQENIIKGKSKKASRQTEEEIAAELIERYSEINADLEIKKMKNWLFANPGRKFTKQFAVNWLNKALSSAAKVKETKQEAIDKWLEDGPSEEEIEKLEIAARKEHEKSGGKTLSLFSGNP